jgi:hypothetical protein
MADQKPDDSAPCPCLSCRVKERVLLWTDRALAVGPKTNDPIKHSHNANLNLLEANLFRASVEEESEALSMAERWAEHGYHLFSRGSDDAPEELPGEAGPSHLRH